MTYYVGTMPVGKHLSHHGIKGMKWGQRRYQNPDGSLTAAGRARYGVSNAYSRARSGVLSAGNRTSSWYKKNKKTIKKVGTAVGVGAAAAGATYLGMRYGKGAVKAVGRAAKGLRRTKFQPSTLSRYGTVRNRVNRGLNNADDFFKGTRGSFKRRAKSIKNGFGNVKRSVSNATIRGRQNWYAAKAARADARAAAKSTLSLNNGFRNKTNRAFKKAGSAFNVARSNFNQKRAQRFAKAASRAGYGASIPGKNDWKKIRTANVKSAFKKAGSAVSGAARKASGAAGSAVRGVGYQARRAGANAKNAARNLGYMAGNVKGNAKRAASKAGTAAKNAAYKAGSKAKTTAARAKNTAKNAKNIPNNAKRVAYNLKNNKAYRYAAIARNANKALSGVSYYNASRRFGASRKQAALVGGARAIGGKRAGIATSVGVGAYNRRKRKKKSRR